MKIEQIYTGCLAQGAYYIESEGEVAVIDPLREVTPYIERAARDGAKIKYVLKPTFTLILCRATWIYPKNGCSDCLRAQCQNGL